MQHMCMAANVWRIQGGRLKQAKAIGVIVCAFLSKGDAPSVHPQKARLMPVKELSKTACWPRACICWSDANNCHNSLSYTSLE